MMKEINIHYDLFKRPAFLLVSVFLFLIPYASIDFQQCYVQASQFTADLSFNQFLFTVLFNKFLFALLGLGLLVMLIQLSKRWLGLSKMKINLGSIFRIQGALLLVAVVSTIVYLLASTVLGSIWNPVDFGLETEPDEMASVLMSQFSFLTVLSLLLGNVNVVYSAINEGKKHRAGTITIEAFNSLEMVHLKPADVTHFEKVGRQYWAYTVDRNYRVKAHLTALEDQLKDLGFFRANRATLINKAFVEQVSFWEHDKYILRLKNLNKTEMVISRKSWRLLKEGLNKQSDIL